MIFAYMIAVKSILVRALTYGRTHEPTSSGKANLELFLKDVQPLSLHKVISLIATHKLHPESDEPEILIIFLELKDVTNCLVFHDILYVDGDCGINRFCHYSYFGSFNTRKDEFSVYFIIFSSVQHNELIVFVFLLSNFNRFSDMESCDALNHLKALNFKLYHADLAVIFQTGVNFTLRKHCCQVFLGPEVES